MPRSRPELQVFFSRRGPNRSGYAIFALVMLATVAAAVYFVFFWRKEHHRIDSIAVLPLENSSQNPELNFVSDGLSEALIDRLSQLPQLKVIARNSSFAFRGANTDLREVARKLGVRALVTGTVAQVNDELIIRIEIVDAVENTHLTGAHFRRKAGNVLDIQSEIARMTVEKLQLKLTDSQSKRLAGTETDNSEAYRFYLNGLVELNGPSGARGRALNISSGPWHSIRVSQRRMPRSPGSIGCGRTAATTRACSCRKRKRRPNARLKLIPITRKLTP